MSFTRRRLLQATAAGLLVPSSLRAASPSAADRRFLFVFAKGGWDQGYVFAPEMLSIDGANADPDGIAAEINGIPFIDNFLRPNVSDFFSDYGDRAVLINGLEFRSLAHAMCTRLVLSGGQDGVADDWASIIAAHGSSDLVMPHVLVSGPSMTHLYTSAVVRVGLAGQFGQLLDGSALSSADLEGLPASAEDPVERYLLDRTRALEAAAADGRGAQDFYGVYGDTLEHMVGAQQHAGELDLAAATDLDGQIALALSCFELGLSRTAFVTSNAYQDLSWDSHGKNDIQHESFEELFGSLNALMAELDTRTSPSGLPLSEETVVVVFSEMGRTPRMNHEGGKDHWTFTSALLVGAGLQGGQAIGGYDDEVLGKKIDLATGEVDQEGGVGLNGGHLGATLLALADVDPTPFTDAGPLESALA